MSRMITGIVLFGQINPKTESDAIINTVSFWRKNNEAKDFKIDIP